VLTLKNWAGMAVTLAGIALVVLRKADRSAGNGRFNMIRLSYPVWGVVLGLLGAIGQSAGLILSKLGMQDYDAFAASQIRVLAGIIGFAVLFTVLGRWRDVLIGLSIRKPMLQLSLGAFFGPFLGVSFSLIAIKYTHTGIAATLMSIVPVLIIIPSMLFFDEKVTFREVTGAVLAVGGVALFFL
jgi:drug/metabolite transporter (DMT)-like permease